MPVQNTIATQNQIAQNYLALLGRNPDPGGFSFWIKQLSDANNTPAAQLAIVNGFGDSAEFRSTYAARTTSSAVSLLYQNVLLRAPDSSGLTYWTNYANTLIANGQSISNAYAQTAAQIIYTAAANGSSDSAGINSRTAAAVTQGTTAPIVTTTLTTNVDTLSVGPNALVIGTVGTTAASTTLQAGDSIIGNGLNNMLRVVDTNGNARTALDGITLAGVQTLQVQNTVNGLGNNSTYNLATTTGVTIVQSSNAAGNSGTVFTNLATGTIVSVSGSASGALASTGFTYANTTSPVIINLNGGIANVQIIQNVSGFLNNIASAPTSATLTSTGGVNGVAANGISAAAVISFTSNAAVTGGTASLTSLTVNASTNLTATLDASDFATSGAALTVAGAATSVNLVGDNNAIVGNGGIYRTIDASSLTAGGVTVNASSTLTSFIGGAGNDNLTNQFGGGAVIRSTASIDAGPGVDTVASTLVNSGNGAVFRNFEVLELGGEARGSFDASILPNSVLTGVSIGAVLGAALVVSNLVENAAGFNVIVTGDARVNSILGFTAASIVGSADIVNYTFRSDNGRPGDARTIGHQGIEQVTIASGGIADTTNFLAISDSALQTITITGVRDFTFGGLQTLDEFGIGGSSGQAALGANLITQLTRIDGSGATGALTITDRGAQTIFGVVGTNVISKAAVTILGGSGNDTFNVRTQPAGTTAGAPLSFGGDTVTTGAGVDRVNVQNATALSTTDPAFTTITDLARGDSIGFANLATSTFNRTAVNVGAATSLIGALNIALAANTATVGATSYFVFGGNTFVVDNVAAAATLNTIDIVVRLTGVVDLSTSSIVNNGVFTFA